MNHSNSGGGGGINNGRGFQWTPYISMHTVIWLFAVETNYLNTDFRDEYKEGLYRSKDMYSFQTKHM